MTQINKTKLIEEERYQRNKSTRTFDDGTGQNKLYMRRDDGSFFEATNSTLNGTKPKFFEGTEEARSSNASQDTLRNNMIQVPVVNVGANIGNLQEFNPSSDWTIYAERLEQYFRANYVDESRKVSVLITAIGPEVYKTLRDLCDPVLPQNKTYSELCDILRKQYSPRISIFKERKEFYDLSQAENESVSQWYARVKKGAVHCEFGAELEGRLKDKFVTGMKAGKILDRV